MFRHASPWRAKGNESAFVRTPLASQDLREPCNALFASFCIALFTPLPFQVAKLGPCAKFYLRLEECLGENDRDFAKCQQEVLALQECTERQGKSQHNG